ncbi:unnamed protein product [Didymodactylos carnosus]|uniref:UBC core domain-containing protein n=1 Tax=Didymodactylos carnosus TaxID=1234261 RepID=A0A815ZFY2_9BILA|nr:unnamed protein product [Didymodactylos carnosus]CAF4451234.1 unnamed protein product [Didymodactylos carnosus]
MPLLLERPENFPKPVSSDGGNSRRITKELRELVIGDPILMAGPINNDLFHWEAIIQGPINTPYENGKFINRILFTDLYPIKPPKCYMMTKIFHPNIHEYSGEICLTLLDRGWRTTLTVGNILSGIYNLLQQPNSEFESCLNLDAGRLLDNIDEFNRIAKEYTVLHAI